jgi:hypothetical protein
MLCRRWCVVLLSCFDVLCGLLRVFGRRSKIVHCDLPIHMSGFRYPRVTWPHPDDRVHCTVCGELARLWRKTSVEADMPLVRGLARMHIETQYVSRV